MHVFDVLTKNDIGSCSNGRQSIYFHCLTPWHQLLHLTSWSTC